MSRTAHPSPPQNRTTTMAASSGKGKEDEAWRDKRKANEGRFATH